MRILVAEDEPAAAADLCQTLEKWGHKVEVAADGAAAWQIYQASPASLVISDWMMPNVDGVELCRRIRSFHAPQYTFIMLLTAKKSRDARLQGLRAGADDFLAKPLDVGELFARLEVARRIATMEEQLQARTVEMSALHAHVERRNADLAEAMTYLTHANRRFTELFESLPAACYSWDAEGRIHEWNRAAVDMFGYQAEEVVTRQLWDVFSDTGPGAQGGCASTVSTMSTESTVSNWQQKIARVFAGESLIGVEMEKRSKDGRRLDVLCNVLPMRTPDGIINGAITAQIDITERKLLEGKLAEQLRRSKRLNVKLGKQRQELAQVNARLKELVTTDGLTGLKNHRHFREILESGFAFATRQALPCSVIMLDVDHFKLYNDTYGHPAGDDVLRTVSAILSDNVRVNDVVARYGGEEFIALCPATGEAAALQVAERLRTAIERQAWPLRPITASFGVAAFGLSTRSASELVDHADRALYRSKREGRNMVTSFSQTGDEMFERTIPALA